MIRVLRGVGGWGAALRSPCRPVRWPGSGLAHAYFGHIQKLFCLPFLEPRGTGVLEGLTLWTPRVVEHIWALFLLIRKVCSIFGPLGGEISFFKEKKTMCDSQSPQGRQGFQLAAR